MARAKAVSIQDRLQVTDTAYFELHEKGSVAINLETGSKWTLCPTGTWLWLMQNGKRPVADLIQKIADHFDEPVKKAQIPCLAFLAALLEQGLLEKVKLPKKAAKTAKKIPALKLPQGALWISMSSKEKIFIFTERA